jgi:Chromo (CHRromatin Organisation MOdifier) domain
MYSMRRYFDHTSRTKSMGPLPELLEGKEVYKVETILKHRRRGRGYQYYVKWKGYPITKATWENESAFSNDGDMIQQYKDQYQL